MGAADCQSGLGPGLWGHKQTSGARWKNAALQRGWNAPNEPRDERVDAVAAVLYQPSLCRPRLHLANDLALSPILPGEGG